MARAGFYAIESGRISFRRDGNWYTDDERIDNPRIALLFSRSIKRNPDGSYYLQVADERAPITVEDTPYVVKTVYEQDGAFIIVTNDDEHEPLDPATLEVGRDNVLYCRCKGGAFRARFVRNAYYHLSNNFFCDEGETFSLVVSGRRYPIKFAAIGESTHQ
ncbi:MAG: DUF1285 domain-containing protein [Deltaproteobacteria bacterium]|nr:DUF1285 domain-containing protein [Deltaproteobacteria bacterium]